jgi:hypothetical protein
MYAAALAGLMPGQQPGIGMGRGIGTGARPTGDDSQTTAFQQEQSYSPFQPGQIILQWKTRGLSDPGETRVQFQNALRDVRQRASEAIVQEQIPSSYHGAIQKYFDSLHDQTPPAQP